MMKLNTFIIEKTEDNDQFLLQVNDGNHYLIGETVKNIFDMIKVDSYSRDHLIDEVENKKLVSISRNDLETLIDDKIIPMLVEKPTKKSIKKIFTVFKPKSVEFLMKGLVFLFKEKLFYSLLTIIGITNLLYFYLIDASLYETTSNSFIPVTIGVILSVLVHELGHATAAYSYKVMPKEVGFCMYFIFPAFYTDMNSLWKLEGKKRVIANLGGIYLQLIVNIFLIAMIFLGNFSGNIQYILHNIIMMNMVICLYNLNPFLKFDGYWVYSDMTGIINLSEKSNTVISQLLKFKKPEGIASPALFLYSILRMFFMIFIYIKVSIWGVDNITKTINNIYSKEVPFDLITLLWGIASVGIFLILFRAATRFVKTNIL